MSDPPEDEPHFGSDTLYPPLDPHPVRDALTAAIIVGLVVTIFAILIYRIARS